ncbi:hypothetical protein FBEOM_6365 [Fusarium beomiforme]|uniref:Uncharacterized protein n=1 Tax=Fusarium beomiforme TaxID=44412 RepID=A0A9P5DY38_9HYPO|nr:hypothetical protein FBEOM_6365 [Fusarium beomiforme]
MVAATFTQNFITVDADPSVDTVHLGFAAGNNLENAKAKEAPIAGHSTLVIVLYTTGAAPRAFSLMKPMVFNPRVSVKITGGGRKDDILRAFDDSGNEAIWQLA